ncbi:acyltransferase [Paenibacillus chitinolyticus]|uniref:acyltransferase n=1 Tax=Paenibacillus chitinolyticus TaxID=79263 RepID=UPI002DB99BED|nr:acyltransferase [Paenibacillus chitinolyticus]MEC0244895.1 acyltransferase [Paenibacillus chitinolyticus]
MRKTDRYPVDGPNALWQIYRTVSKWKAVKNFVWIQISRYCPSLPVKNWIYRRMLGMEVGEHTAFALMVMVDVFFPEKIKIGRNSIIGYNTTILAHEYLTKEYRLGEVRIGSNVMVGANTTILPGVTIGDGAVIGAGSVVHKDVEPYSFVAGNPLQVIRTGTSDSAEARTFGASAEISGPESASGGGTNPNSSSS